MLTTPAEELYFKAENLAHREEIVKDTVCPTCLSPCQVNVGAMKQVVPYAKFLVRAYQVKHDPARPSGDAAHAHSLDARTVSGLRLPRPQRAGIRLRPPARRRRPDRVHPLEERSARGARGRGRRRLAADRRRRPPRARRSRADGLSLGRAALHARPGDRARRSARSCAIFFVSTFVGTLPAGSIGGDAVRALQPREAQRPRRRRGGVGLHGSHARRRLAAADGARSGWRSRASWPPTRRSWRRSPRPAALCVADAAADLQPAERPRLARGCVERLPSAAVQSGAATVLLESIRRYAGHHAQLANVLVCSVAVQVLRIVQAYCLGRGLGIDAPLTTYFAFIPLILLVMLLPITFNGIGTGQAAFVWFFAQAGVPRRAAFALVGALHRARHRRQPAGRDPLCVRTPAAAARSRAIMTQPRPTRRRILKGVAIVVYNLVAATILVGNRHRPDALFSAGRRRVAAAVSPPHPAGLPALQPVADPVRPAAVPGTIPGSPTR